MVHSYYMASPSEQLKTGVEFAASDYLFPEFSYLVSETRVYVLTSAFCGQSPRRMLNESMTECKLNAHDQGLEFHQRPLQKKLVDWICIHYEMDRL